MLDQAPSGLITDIDGTIASIVSTPAEAGISPRCRSSLATLAGKLGLVAALSGRDAARAREMVAVDGMVYVGNFGLEKWRDGKVEIAGDARQYLPAIRALVERLHDALKGPGLVIEDKGVTASVHYRLAPEHHQARDAIIHFLAIAPEARGLTVSEGKLVVEIRPPVKLDKGVALVSLVEENGLKGVVCLGDDTSDVVAFRALHSLTSRGRCVGLALGVLGRDSPPALVQEADLLLGGLPEVEELLGRLAEGW